MLIIPAIDLKTGKCVRLKQGKMKKVTIFSQEPVSIAKLWKLKGATLLHIVDLEGAVAGVPCNLNIVTKIIKSVDTPVQLGGGIRDLRTIKKVLSKGVFRVILGTSVFQNLDFLKKCVDIFKEKIVVSLDCFEGKIAISGWNKVTEQNTVELAKELENVGVQTIIYTDIKSDGMLKGPNFEGIENFAQNTKIPFIASGGVSTLNDIKKIKNIKKTYSHLQGLIIGRAIYTENIDLAVAIALGKE